MIQNYNIKNSSNSIRKLRETYPDLKWQEGKLLNGTSRTAIQNWVSNMEYFKACIRED